MCLLVLLNTAKVFPSVIGPIYTDTIELEMYFGE